MLDMKQRIEALQTKNSSLESELKESKDTEASLKSDLEESKSATTALQSELADSKEQAKTLQAPEQRKTYISLYRANHSDRILVCPHPNITHLRHYPPRPYPPYPSI